MLGAPYDYILGVTVIAVLGFMARTFFTGLRENIVKAVVDSALKAILGNLTTGIAELKSDMTLVKSAQQTTANTNLLYMQELHAMRQRLDDHLKADEEFQESARDFRLLVSDFMEWSTKFLKTHMHVGAVVEEPVPKPPLVAT